MTLVWTDKKIINALYIVALIAHLAICLYGVRLGYFVDLSEITNKVVLFYKSIGFKWSDKASDVLVFSLFSSVILNVVRRFFEGWILGWPRFQVENLRALWPYIVRCSLWISFALIGIGAWGANTSREVENIYALIDADQAFDVLFGWSGIASISLMAFICGMAANFVDELLSAICSFLSFLIRRK